MCAIKTTKILILNLMNASASFWVPLRDPEEFRRAGQIIRRCSRRVMETIDLDEFVWAVKIGRDGPFNWSTM